MGKMTGEQLGKGLSSCKTVWKNSIMTNLFTLTRAFENAQRNCVEM